MRTIIAGEKFGKLTVIEKIEYGNAGQRRVRCLCECGKNTETQFNRLVNGHTKSCGCIKKERIKIQSQKNFVNLSGKKYGNWSIGDLITKKGAINYYNCVCECGTMRILAGTKVKTGNSKSCGCVKRKKGSVCGQIYGLYDNNNTLIYIGSTVTKLSNRLCKHVSNPTGKLKKWFENNSYRPKIKTLLNNISLNKLLEIEKEMIKNYSKKSNLLNTTYNNT